MHSWFATLIVGICISATRSSPVPSPIHSLVARGRCPDTPRISIHSSRGGQQVKVKELLDSDHGPFCRYSATFRDDPAIALLPKGASSVNLLMKERNAYDKLEDLLLEHSDRLRSSGPSELQYILVRDYGGVPLEESPVIKRLRKNSIQELEDPTLPRNARRECVSFVGGTVRAAMLQLVDRAKDQGFVFNYRALDPSTIAWKGDHPCFTSYVDSDDLDPKEIDSEKERAGASHWARNAWNPDSMSLCGSMTQGDEY